MKDGFDVSIDIISLINLPDVLALIDGSIYPDVRPDNSKLTDIVVNSLGITNTWNQIAYGNVNIYVPSLSQTQADGTVQAMPDQAKLYSLSKAISPYLDEQYRDTFFTKVVTGGKMMQDTDGSWFVNIQVKYNSIQTNFKNI